MREPSGRMAATGFHNKVETVFLVMHVWSFWEVFWYLPGGGGVGTKRWVF